VTGLATLYGGLAINLTDGFTLEAGDSFDILNFGRLAGDFSSFSLNGHPCSAGFGDSWNCSNSTGGPYLEELISATSLDLLVVDPPGSPVPEPSTWALLIAGFLGLAGLGMRKRARRTCVSAGLEVVSLGESNLHLYNNDSGKTEIHQ
jgi:hypothetical protein